jgi:hypothetical protein
MEKRAGSYFKNLFKNDCMNFLKVVGGPDINRETTANLNL